MRLILHCMMRMVMRSYLVATLFFYFSTQKYFTIKLKILDFLRSLDRFKVFIQVIIIEFYMAWKNFSKIFTYWRGDVCPPHVQTVSTSLLFRLVNTEDVFRAKKLISKLLTRIHV